MTKSACPFCPISDSGSCLLFGNLIDDSNNHDFKNLAQVSVPTLQGGMDPLKDLASLTNITSSRILRHALLVALVARVVSKMEPPSCQSVNKGNQFCFKWITSTN